MTEYLTAEQASEELMVHTDTVRRYVREKVIKASKVGKRWMIPRSEIERVCKEGTKPQLENQQNDKNAVQ